MVRINNEILIEIKLNMQGKLLKNLKHVKKICHLTASLDQRGRGDGGSMVAQARGRCSVAMAKKQEDEEER